MAEYINRRTTNEYQTGPPALKKARSYWRTIGVTHRWHVHQSFVRGGVPLRTIGVPHSKHAQF